MSFGINTDSLDARGERNSAHNLWSAPSGISGADGASEINDVHRASATGRNYSPIQPRINGDSRSRAGSERS